MAQVDVGKANWQDIESDYATSFTEAAFQAELGRIATEFIRDDDAWTRKKATM